MKFIKSTVFMLMAFLAFSFVNEQKFTKVENPETLLKKLQQVSKETNNIQSDFTEKKYIAVLNEPQIAKGKMFYQKENKMKWQQNTPFEYIILINNNNLQIKDNGKVYDKGSLISSKISGFMMGLIKGDYQDSKEYTTHFFQSGKQYKVELIPEVKQLSKVYSKMNLYFAKDTYRLQQIEFFEAGGDRREVDFYNQKYNQPIDKSVFEKL